MKKGILFMTVATVLVSGLLLSGCGKNEATPEKKPEKIGIILKYYIFLVRTFFNKSLYFHHS